MFSNINKRLAAAALSAAVVLAGTTVAFTQKSKGDTKTTINIPVDERPIARDVQWELDHGSRVAIVEYGISAWVRNAPVIGKWDPPIHVLNFLPRQRGHLRVFDSEGREVYREWLPAEGMFEIGFSSVLNEVWCWPAAWFARGMAGAVWLPIDAPARTVYRIGIEDHSTVAFDFPDALADFAARAGCGGQCRGRRWPPRPADRGRR